LDNLLADPEQPISKPTLVSPKQEELLLRTWNPSDFPAPALKTLPAILEEQAQARAEQIAVRDLNGGSLS
ncbi:hypothetical protein, partial [Salmonella enterica]|uniref:hypothetical protein n=1 Tax=Salmonella enterica TaxID=28901 RepID=UPI00329A0A1D